MEKFSTRPMPSCASITPARACTEPHSVIWTSSFITAPRQKGIPPVSLVCFSTDWLFTLHCLSQFLGCASNGCPHRFGVCFIAVFFLSVMATFCEDGCWDCKDPEPAVRQTNPPPFCTPHLQKP